MFTFTEFYKALLKHGHESWFSYPKDDIASFHHNMTIDDHQKHFDNISIAKDGSSFTYTIDNDIVVTFHYHNAVGAFGYPTFNSKEELEKNKFGNYNEFYSTQKVK